VRQLIRGLPVGAKLPAERELASMYGCNFLTVRRALKQLTNDGWIARRPGSGTFVARNAEAARPGMGPVGVLVYKEGNAYASRLLQAIAEAGGSADLEIRSGWVRDLAGDALAQALRFQQEGCTALTLPWFPHEQSEAVRALVGRSPLPISLALLIPGLERHCYIQPELFEASTTGAVEEVCRYFQGLGETRIAYLGPDSPHDAVLQYRLAAYHHFTARENLPRLCGLAGPGAPAMDELAERWREFRGHLAVVAYDDEHALRFMTAMHKLGLGAPEDYRIVGYNDTEASRFSDPPLSTIHQDFDFIAHGLLQSALGLAGPQPRQCDRTPRPILLVRSTCGGAGRVDEALRARLPEIDLASE